MEVDCSFLDPIKSFHPILRVVEMEPDELATLLPLRINRFCFVTQPYAESFGFPIDAPKISGVDLVKLHIALTEQMSSPGSPIRFEPKLELEVKRPRYNKLVPALIGEELVWYLQGKNGRPTLVLYQGILHEMSTVADHINALVIYCNALYHDPQNAVSPLLPMMPRGYIIDCTGRLISHGKIHGRWDYNEARDLLFSCILNYIRL